MNEKSPREQFLARGFFWEKDSGLADGCGVGVVEEVVRDDPFVAVLVAPQLRASHEEYAPVVPPASDFVFAVGFGEDWFDGCGVGIHPFEPRVGSFFVVGARDVPVLGDAEMILEVEEGVVGRHLSAREKVFCHPVVFTFDLVVVCEFLVGEDVDEQFSRGFEPGRNLSEQALVIFQMLEHFDGNDAIELGGFRLEIIDVNGFDRDVGEISRDELGFDPLALAAGIGNRGNFRVGVMLGHPEGERAPAAAEFEDGLPVGEFGAFAGEREHSGFGRFDVAHAFIPVARAVFEIGAEAVAEKFGRQLVVLLVCLLGVNGEWGGFERGDVAHERGLALFDVEFFERGERGGEALADAEADERVGNRALGDEFVGKVHEIRKFREIWEEGEKSAKFWLGSGGRRRLCWQGMRPRREEFR